MKTSSLKSLQDKLTKLEALYERPGSEGEKTAAAVAILKIRSKIMALQSYQRPKVETYTFTVFKTC